VRLSITSDAEDLATLTRDAMNETPVIDPLSLFDHIYAQPRPALLEQREFLARELASIEPGTPS